ncbi:metallophosphoesterase family protein [Virgibacillus sp. W0430]|uniref:metallophosphoesterase family protein n=1 Tax=Virgibacillus sp. W0430 TaxID=3391580 RepID=UPI003F46F3EE
MTKKISFLHAADLHLDSPFKGLASVPEHLFKEIAESTFTALDRLVQAAIDKKVDFVLLVGDLFDNERRGLRAQIKLRKAFEQLKHHHISVYISYGNHDYIKGNIHHVSYPDNVFVFKEENVQHFTFKRNNQSLVNIYGFSYVNKAITTNKAQTYKVVEEQIPFHIALLHGSYQQNSTHDMYAPFLLNDLVKEDFDYWALGHIHQRQTLKEDPLIVYPGNIQGRHRNERGEKGCYYVELTETDASLDFIPLHAIEFQTLDIDISSLSALYEIEKKVQTSVQSLSSTTPVLLSLTLHGDTTRQPVTDHTITELIELINETFIHETQWRYIYQVNTKLNERDTMFTGDDYFIGELTKQMEHANIYPFLSELYNHRQAKKYLQSIEQADEKAIKKAACNLLLDELLNDGGE